MKKRFKQVAIACPATGQEVTVSPRWASRITGRSVRTAQRWASGGRMDKASTQLLQMRIFGVIPWGDWAAFRVRDQILENVETGETWTPYQLRSAWVLFQKLREYERTTNSRPPILRAVITVAAHR